MSTHKICKHYMCYSNHFLSKLFTPLKYILEWLITSILCDFKNLEKYLKGRRKKLRRPCAARRLPTPS